MQDKPIHNGPICKNVAVAVHVHVSTVVPSFLPSAHFQTWSRAQGTVLVKLLPEGLQLGAAFPDTVLLGRVNVMKFNHLPNWTIWV